MRIDLPSYVPVISLTRDAMNISKKFAALSSVVFFFLLFSSNALATSSALTVSTSINLSSDTYNANYPNIQNVGSNVYVAWSEGSHGIWFKVSHDGGLSWSVSTRLSPTGVGSSQFPLVAAVGTDVYVVWSQAATTIDIAVSTNSGDAFLPAVIVSGTIARSITPVVAAAENNVYVVWNGNGSSYLAFSKNNGLTWSNPFKYASGPEPQVAAYGSSAYAIADTFSRVNSAVYYTNNNGSTWSRSGTISGAEPWVSAYGSNVIVASESKGNQSVVRIITSTNFGHTFTPVRILSANVTNSWAPMTWIFGNTEYVAWRTNPGSARSQEYVSTSTNAGVSWSTPLPIGISGRDNSWPVTVASTSSAAFIQWYVKAGTTSSSPWQAVAAESTNNGSSWSQPLTLGRSLGESDVATSAISANGSTFYSVWTNAMSTGRDQVYFATGS